jgi:6-pyruvoyltetrahydropterin/6-carboxytetrahydropterin synthase
MSLYFATKTYSPERGLSCAFRQWRAQSHCRFLHGYALGVRLTFASRTLDARNWVYDFGGLTWLKQFLDETFDHKTCIAQDDPERAVFEDMAARDIIQLTILPNTSGEAFARAIHDFAASRIADETDGRVALHAVEVFEHSGNSAIYQGD